ncbi:GTPase ObgE, partial [bacterium]|nr:GTPase ObgE [bacterium]
GGPGAVTFRREKFVAKGGPDGGDGGKGGDVIFRAQSRLQTLMDLTLKRRYVAGNGEKGSKRNCYGSDGQTLVIEVPCGTMIFNEDGEMVADLTESGTEFVAGKGGKGGLGNARFATSTNRVPRYAQPGLPGDEGRFRLELRLLAQVGLVGQPNAGKSTLLKALTRANPKIADYPFTTLFPNLGVLRVDDREIVVADIPGLIEGASQGQGLGADFLRHIDRTQLLIHVVAAGESPEVSYANYATIEKELGASEFDLSQKPIFVVLSKCDLLDSDGIVLYTRFFESKGIDVIPVSGVSGYGMEVLIKRLLTEVPNE